MIKLGYIIIYVPDVVQSLEWYKDTLGFEVRFIGPDKDYGELITGETTLAFAHSSLGKDNIGDYEEVMLSGKPLGIEIAFTSDNVDALYQKIIDHGGTSLTPPTAKPWGQTVAYVRDPFGTLLEICTPIQ